MRQIVRQDIEIVGMTLVREPQVNKGGGYILARFDCEVNGFMLFGCALARTSRQGLVAWPPRLDATGDRRRMAVTIVDDGLRHKLLDTARTMYIAMGGKHAEWIPQGESDPVREYVEALS